MTPGRVRCDNCGHEYLLAFSCKRRHFCPSCHQKRVVEFGEWLCQDAVKAVPHRHAVLSIPKILRRYFLYDRSLLSDLSRCGWEAVKAFYTTGVRDRKAVPVEDPVFSGGAVAAMQTFGDFPLGFHPHLHILVSDGCFHENGLFSVSPTVDTKAVEQIFRHKVLKMLLAKGKITRDMIALLDKWRHSLSACNAQAGGFIKGSSPLLTFSLRDVIKKCSAAFLGRMSYNVTWGRRLFRRLDYMVDSIKTS